MCVILQGPADKILPLAEDAMRANPHGTGIAWTQANGKLAYRKGITSPRRARRILAAIGKGDAVLHARIATSGGQHALLTHPFSVERGSPVMYADRDADWLLFHNGIASLDWRSHVPAKSGLYWSDTRTIAHALATGSVALADLERDGGRWLHFYRAQGRTFILRVGHWQEHRGVACSNLSFLWQRPAISWSERAATQAAAAWSADERRAWRDYCSDYGIGLRGGW